MGDDKERKCENCRYFEELDGDAGRCRESSPRAFLNIMVSATEAMTVWPKVSKDDWCGEFKES